MIKALKSIKLLLNKYPFIREIILYGIIGCLSASLDSLVFVLLRSVGTNLYVANFISINVGIMISFWLNTYFNFKLKDKFARRMLKFFLIGYFGLLLSMGMMYIGTDVLIIREIVVKLVSIAVIAVIQFILNKFVTYKKNTAE